MARQLPADPDVALASLQAVDGADVVEAPAGHVVPRGGVSAGHHPGGAQRDGVYLCIGREEVYLEATHVKLLEQKETQRKVSFNTENRDAYATEHVTVSQSNHSKGGCYESTTLLQEKDFTPLSLPVRTEAKCDYLSI